jgi:alanyl-tRNA synthetase
MLGLDQPFMVPLVEAVIERMSPAYPELTGRREFIIELVAREESRFAETLLTGMQLLEDMMAGAGEGRMITGEQAFRLYDTYGFPLDLTMEIASGKGFGVDEAGFDREMGRQREKARAGARFGTDKAVPLDHTFQHTCFTGYDTLSQYGTIDGIIRNNAQTDVISEGEHGGLVLDKTAFYAEMGGQAGDIGRITAGDSVFEVTGTVLLSPGVTIHQGYVARGAFRIGDEALTAVDPTTRYDTARNHTATHLLQAALIEVLGEHIQQRGSVVAPDRLRFDFSHLKAVTPEELIRVEAIVNERIRENHPVTAAETGYRDALKSGVTALFGEKYGETVRVLSIGSDRRVSAELCGGTHIRATGEIGYFKIISESSVGAGLRRIEAVTGRGAEAWLSEQFTNSREKLERLQTELDDERRSAAELKRELARQRALSLTAGARDIDGGKLLAVEVPDTDMETLRDMADELRGRLGSAVIVLASVQGDKPVFLAAVTDDLVARGYHAGNIIKRLSQIAGGGGGGKPHLAQGGGRDKSRLAEALAAVNEFIR